MTPYAYTKYCWGYMEILSHETIFQRGHSMETSNAFCQGGSVKNPLHL